MRLPCALSFAALLVVGLAARAGAPRPDAEVEVKRLTLRPAPEPAQALRYTLLPPSRELKPGNALLFYYRAFSPESWSRVTGDKDFYEKLEKWQTVPLAQLPTGDGAWVARFRALEDVDAGARRQSCDWELTDRLRAEGVGTLMPDLQSIRTFGALLSVRCRLEMAAGDFDKAIYTLQTGFGLAKHCGEGPTLIHGLIGYAIGSIMLARVEELIQQPEAPNLYWALTALPRGLIDIRHALQGEEVMVSGYLPDLRELEKAPMTVARAREVLEAVVKKTGEWGGLTGERPVGPAARWTTAGWIALAYPRSRERLVAAGYHPDWVAAAPAIQVVLLDTVSEFTRIRDNLFKGFNLPFPEGRPIIERAAAEERKVAAENPQNVQLRMLLSLFPAVEKIHLTTARTERRIATLCAIEAIRMDAAAHGGRPPMRLADVATVPVPNDPLTGKPFDYEAGDGKASLTAPPGRGLPRGGGYAWRFELAFVQ